MKKQRFLSITSILSALVFAGCPAGGNINAANSVTLHNNLTRNIVEFSITRLGPVDPVDGKAGMNMLPEPLEPGESFTVDNLVDGNYQMQVIYYYDDTHTTAKNATQSLEGGRNYDWYVSPSKFSNDIEPGAPTAKAIVDQLLGIR